MCSKARPIAFFVTLWFKDYAFLERASELLIP